MSDTDKFALLMQWVAELPKRAFQVEYGYGICEVPWVRLLNDGTQVFSGPLNELGRTVGSE